MSLDRFNSRFPQCRMLVQTYMIIEGCPIEEIVGSVMAIHMDCYDMITEGLLHVYFIDSVNQPINMCFMMKSCEFHVRSSSLFRKAFVGFISHP
jgi:hypothetical protein